MILLSRFNGFVNGNFVRVDQVIDTIGSAEVADLIRGGQLWPQVDGVFKGQEAPVRCCGN